MCFSCCTLKSVIVSLNLCVSVCVSSLRQGIWLYTVSKLIKHEHTQWKYIQQFRYYLKIAFPGVKGVNTYIVTLFTAVTIHTCMCAFVFRIFIFVITFSNMYVRIRFPTTSKGHMFTIYLRASVDMYTWQTHNCPKWPLLSRQMPFIKNHYLSPTRARGYLGSIQHSYIYLI